MSTESFKKKLREFVEARDQQRELIAEIIEETERKKPCISVAEVRIITLAANEAATYAKLLEDAIEVIEKIADDYDPVKTDMEIAQEFLRKLEG